MLVHDDEPTALTPRGPKQLQLFDIEPDPSIVGCVYAVLMPSHAIKFGWTGRSPRLRAGELKGYLLASSVGTLADEAMFHRRLSPYRIGRTEDFWPAPEVWNAVDVLNLAAARRTTAGVTHR